MSWIERWRGSRRRRWQVIAVVVAFYLVRDLLLYVALPALVWFKTR